ncbi:MAG: osmotic-shock protein [Thiotrichales bacterium SG8_50]|jgi:YggT family protein|nr:MAG: osmotic-shock protein [Thiotrichales bacterium SG8_50]
MSQGVVFLLETFVGLFVLALLLRFFLQAVRAPARNPLSNFVAALTDFAVRPARRVVPGLWGYDLSSLVLAWLLQIALMGVVLSIKGYDFAAPVGVAAVGLICVAGVNLLKTFIYIVLVATIIQAVLSWINPYSPVAPILNAMTRPFLGVFRRRIPPIGGVDLSPLFVLVVCQLLLMWPIAYLEAVFVRFL